MMPEKPKKTIKERIQEAKKTPKGMPGLVEELRKGISEHPPSKEEVREIIDDLKEKGLERHYKEIALEAGIEPTVQNIAALYAQERRKGGEQAPERKAGESQMLLEDKTSGLVRRFSETVRKIFEIEGAALGNSSEKQKELFQTFNDYADDIYEAVKGDGINTLDEEALFSSITGVFYSNFNASYATNQIISTSIEDNKFNCYSSSLLFAGVLAKFGKEMQVVTVPGHVFLLGEKYAYETTSKKMSSAYFPKSDLSERYPIAQVGGFDFLVACSYGWTGSLFKDNKDYDKAIESYKKVIELNPKYADAYNNMGLAYGSKKDYDKAIESYKKAIELNPKDAEIYNSMGIAYGSKKTTTKR